MHRTRKTKTFVRGSTTDLVSANDANIAPGLGDVSQSNIIAGVRKRKGTRANDNCSGESKKVSAGNSFHNPEIDPADGHHDSLRYPGITLSDDNVDSTLDAGIDGKRTSKAGRKTARVDSCNHDKRAKAGGNARDDQSGNDDAVESSDYHNNSIAKAGGNARDDQSGSDDAVESSNIHNNSIAKAGGKAHGNQSGNDNALESSDIHNNSIAKAGGKARGNQSGNDDAVESSDYHNNSIPDDKTHGSGRARKPPAKKL
jgi:hypothetical protein